MQREHFGNVPEFCFMTLNCAAVPFGIKSLCVFIAVSNFYLVVDFVCVSFCSSVAELFLRHCLIVSGEYLGSIKRNAVHKFCK